MDDGFTEGQPIYRQLRDRVIALILDGVLGEGEALPSVRTVAAEGDRFEYALTGEDEH